MKLWFRTPRDGKRQDGLVERAEAFAIAAHEAVGQKRKYTGVPYWHHLQQVVALVASVPHDDEMLAAAFLHDVVEDTPITLDTIEMMFGAGVRALVFWLTDQSMPEDGNRAMRKAVDRRHIAEAPARAQTIKLADLIDNTASIVQHDPDFAKVYLEEKRLLLDVLVRGDVTLMAMARGQIGG